MIAWIPIAAGLGSAALGAWQSHRAGRSAERGMNQMSQEAERRRRQQEAQAQQSRGLYQSAVQGFDPQQYMQQAAGSAFNDLSGQFNQANAQRMTGLNSRGLFGSNLGGNRQQVQFNDALANRLAGLSMNAAGMEQQRQGMLGNIYGMDQGYQRSLQDDVWGMRGAGLQQRAMSGASAGQGWGQLGGTLLGAGVTDWLRRRGG